MDYLGTTHPGLGVKQAPPLTDFYTPAKTSNLRLFGRETRAACALENNKPNYQLPILLSAEAVARAQGQQNSSMQFFRDFPESLHHLPTYTPVSGRTLQWWPTREYLETEDLLP